MNCEMMSIGTGKMMVEFFSAEIVFRVWRYRSWKRKKHVGVKGMCRECYRLGFPLTCSAEGLSDMTSEASLSALDAFCSPSAAIT